MRKVLFFVLLPVLFFSCSTDVDIYADYKEVPVVYGLLNAKADTNYIKITKTYCGTNDDPINALEVAPIYDSSNYPGKLDAFFVELKSDQGRPFQPTGRQFFLDTLTIHNKEEGLFYAPDQLLYYTDEPFKINAGGSKYRYRLYIVTPDRDTVMAETGIVAGDINVSTSTVNFQSAPSHSMSPLVFNSTEEAVLYEIGMRFNYWEGHPGSPMQKKSVSWSFRPRTLGEYEKVVGSEDLYRAYYSANTLFSQLERAIGNDTVWDANHPNVIRKIDSFDVFIAAAGDDFYIYYQYLQTLMNGLSLSTEYSNVAGGHGILSSRIFVSHKVKISSTTKLDLFRKPWGFQE